jgi:hypothetical protein
MAVAQGLYKTLAYKKQTALGTPAIGAGGQLLRRETSTFEKTKAGIASNEIVSHQQYLGDTYGVGQTQGQLMGLMSAGSYAPLITSLLRGSLTAGVAIAGLSLTIAGAGPTFTITRGAGSYLTDGFKIGDVVQLSVGAFTGTATALNMVVVALTATVATVIVPNGSVLSAQGPIVTSTLTVINKKALVPSTGQANDYYTFEEWFADIARSRIYTDTQVVSCDIKVPANGNASIQFSFLGLARAINSAQQMTAPSLASTSAIISAENAAIVVAGAQTILGTSVDIKIDGQLKAGDPVIGSKQISDIIKGDIKVTGNFSHLKTDETLTTLFENESPLSIIAVLFADTTATSPLSALSFRSPSCSRTALTTAKSRSSPRSILWPSSMARWAAPGRRRIPGSSRCRTVPPDRT